MSQDYNSYYYIKSAYALGYTVSSEPCVLKAIIVNDVTTQYVIGIVDGTSGTTPNVGKLRPTVTGSYLYNCQLTNGLRIVPLRTVSVSGFVRPDITVITRR